jgi:hypothetical protein
MKLKNLFRLLLLALVIMCIAPSCVKEGPAGKDGTNGTDGAPGTPGKDGTNGVNGGSDCKLCHNPTTVDLIATQFQLSKHEFGEAAFEEAGNTGCTPCHAQEAFKYVVKNNTPVTFTLNATTGKYVNNYATIPSAAYGDLGCSTCHSAIHSTYGTADMVLTTVAAVPMTMWAGAKEINLTQDGGNSNLCVKCHQPRPQTNLQTGNVQDYVGIAANPTVLAYDAANDKATTNIVRPSYRMHVHYGAVGAVFAGKGGVEFAGADPYVSSVHTNTASCVACHMGADGGKSAMVGKAGGHSFSAVGNFNTCSATGCHTTPITAKDPNYWVDPRATVQQLLMDLAAKLTVSGVEIMNRNNTSANLWLGITKNNYDGYLNVFDPINNPDFASMNPSGTFQNPAPSSSWTAEQKALNATFPKLSLTNAQYGACLNFQLCLRDYSLGIHNYKYTKALLKNTIAILN